MPWSFVVCSGWTKITSIGCATYKTAPLDSLHKAYTVADFYMRLPQHMYPRCNATGILFET